jgi:hypothetical protein
MILVANFGAVVRADDASKILGKVVSAETGEPLPYANLILSRITAEGDTVAAGGTFVMPDGTYRLDATPGRYQILASFIGYHALTITDVEVPEDNSLNLDISLTPSAISIETVEVTAKALRSTSIAVIAERRKSAAVSDGISNEEISRTSDSNAAEALQRVTGLSVVGGQYVFVRGLGERYSSSTINGTEVGSPETNKRVLPMDLFASSLIDNVVVQKTYTPDQPGEFGGGVVDMETREFPGEKIWSVSTSSGFNSNTTGRTFRSYYGGGRDWLGFDDGTRDLPKDVPRDYPVKKAGLTCTENCLTGDQVVDIGRSFNLDWRTKSNSGSLPRSFSGTYGNEFEVMGRRLGLLGSVTYLNTLNTEQRVENEYRGGETLNPLTAYDVNASTSSVLWGVLASLGYRLGNFHTIRFNAMYNRSADDTYTSYQGLNENFTGGVYIKQTRFEYVERGIFTATVGMRHNVPRLFGSLIDWKFGYSNSTRDEPDRRSWVYELEEGVYKLSTRGPSIGFNRTFGKLNEDTRTADINWSLPFRQWGGLEAKLKTGAHFSKKERSFRYRRFAYLTPGTNRLDRSLPPESLLVADNIKTSTTLGGFEFREFPQPDDNYDASHDISAQYVLLELPVIRNLRAVGGARREMSDQSVTTFNLFDPSGDGTNPRERVVDWLPAVNLTYAVTEKTNLRAAFSETLNRPDLRELSKFVTIVGGVSTRPEGGNPDLHRCRIQNYDVRAEVFPTLNELLAASAFYKKLDQPIEAKIDPSGVIIPVNGKDGYLYGMELEGRLGLNRFSSRLSSFGLNANLTLVKSQASIDSVGVQHSNTRPLTGQSPYVANVGLFYTSASGMTEASLLYTAFGRRLYTLGQSALPDVYEQPHHSLDVSVSRQVAGVRAKLSVENLLGENSLFKEGPKVTKKINSGRTVGFSLSTGS